MARWLTIAAVAAAAVLLAAVGGAPIAVNISPLARVIVNGKANAIVEGAPFPRRAADVLGDGFVDDQYLGEIPSEGGRCIVEFQFPFVVDPDRLLVIGWSGGSKGRLLVERIDAASAVHDVFGSTWEKPAPDAPWVSYSQPGSAKSFRLSFATERSTILNSVQFFVDRPRWKGWCWFAGLQIVAPWMFGGLWLAALMGWGSVICTLGRRGSDRDEDPSPWLKFVQEMLVGLAATTIASAAWFALPDQIRWGPAGCLLFAALLVPAVIPINRVFADPNSRRAWFIVGATALLLLTAVAVDSTVVHNRRVKPMDHFMGFLTAQHLLANATPPHETALRPWMVPALVAPVVASTSPFDYWLCLGQMGWMNAGVLFVAGLWLERWRRPVFPLLALFAALPLMTIFHFPGQRPLVAGLTLAAAYFWLERSATRWAWWGGLAAILAVLAHPGALFVLPPFAIYFLLRTTGADRRAGLLGVAAAAAVYIAWSTAAAQAYGRSRNPLAYYPIMRTLDEEFPRDQSPREIVASLSAKHWRDLAANRVKQLRHYLWAENPWHSQFTELLRPVSLAATLGVALSLFLFWKAFGRRPTAFVWAAIVGPLLLFHLHIGQEFPQFHILPTPFFAMTLIAVAYLRSAPTLLWFLVSIEAFLHQAFLPALAVSGVVGDFPFAGWFSNDRVTQLVLNVLPLAVWAPIAWMAWRGRQAP